nr:C10 family peptidase [Bacteroidota bacterium]
NQDCYYNNDCPADASGPCGHVYAGCGAVAMAQQMKYYSHPSTGTGSHSYTHATYGLQSANFGTTTYDYSQMPNSISANNSHIAQLMYHCGVSVDMDYGTSGSGCWSNAIDAALKTHFDYSSSQAWDWRGNYTDPQWLTLVKAELDGGHPLIYYGNNAGTNGHFFNCDGYNDSDYLHINWGWSGAYNGYFQVTSLVPLSGYIFTDNQGAIFGSYPNATTSYCAATSLSCDVNWITQAHLEGINNSTDCTNYTDYSASDSAEVAKGGSYTMRLISRYPGAWTNTTAKCWIDWNQDYDFDDSGESFTLTYLYNFGFPNANGVFQGNIDVPADATTGNTIMRVRITGSQTSNDPCGSAANGEVEDYGIVVSGDSPPPAQAHPWVFSVDIGSDTELSDIQADGDEVFDPGDAYLYTGSMLPSGGADGLVNDASLFFTDPAPIPGYSGTNAPIGGGELPAPLLFDMDGIDYTVVPVNSKDYGPGLPSVPQYTDSLIFPPEFFLISYDDDSGPNYSDPAGSVAVNSFSPSTLAIFGKSQTKDEVVEVDFPISYTYPVSSSTSGNVSDEFPVHFNLNPNPDPNNTPDDDIDALDVYDVELSPYGFMYFSADHEAYYFDPNTSLPLNPGNIYMANAGGGTFIEVINAQINLGLNPDTDVDAFEFAWLQDAQMGYIALALLF